MNNTTKANDEFIWNFLKSKRFNDFAIAGIMGNLYAESGMIPNNLQNSFEKKLGYTDTSYTAAVDSGEYANYASDGAGYGLAQWTYPTRKQALLDFAKAQKASIGDLQMQLDFLWKELQGYTKVMSVLKNAKSVLEASNIVLMEYERPADMGDKVQALRAEYGMRYFDKYADKSAFFTVERNLTDEAASRGLMNSPDYWFEVITGKTTASARNVQYLIEKALAIAK